MGRQLLDLIAEFVDARNSLTQSTAMGVAPAVRSLDDIASDFEAALRERD